MPNGDAGEKTLIGVLASHDSEEKNIALANVFRNAYDNHPDLLSQFRFVFTGGTYERLFHGNAIPGGTGNTAAYRLSHQIKSFLHNSCGVICLPSAREGGVTILSCLITQRHVSIIWPFLSPITTHMLFPENLALLRLSDHWRVKKFMNTGSVEEWFLSEAERDCRLNIQPNPIEMSFPGSGLMASYQETSGTSNVHSVTLTSVPPFPDFLGARAAGNLVHELEETVIALISHDAMKDRMMDFVIDYEHELQKFGSIVTTGTTGKLVAEASPTLQANVYRYHSGPKGGDIEIATEIVFGGCHVVIFFVDPLNPHPHTEDIRVVFGACMINDQVRMLSNEMQARDWIHRICR